jgi:hypothetical protein
MNDFSPWSIGGDCANVVAAWGLGDVDGTHADVLSLSNASINP